PPGLPDAGEQPGATRPRAALGRDVLPGCAYGPARPAGHRPGRHERERRGPPLPRDRAGLGPGGARPAAIGGVRMSRGVSGGLAGRARALVGRGGGVGRIPYARTILLIQLAAALLFVGYTLVKKEVRLPFSPEPYYVDVILPDAKGLSPAKDPAAGV